MKKLYSLLSLVLITISLSAQSPQKMGYQAVIRNNSNVLVASSPVGMRISILQASETGTPVYVETQTPITNTNGLATIEIGAGNIVTGIFGAIDWSAGPYFIKTETDPAGGIAYSITGTSQLLSVPYALYAKIAAASVDAVNLTGDQSIAGTKTFTGTINASNKVISSVATPVSATDAATKAYVDVMLQRINQLESQPGVVKDYDGNLYTTVKIGNQVWMAENLKTTKYNDGTSIANVTVNATWAALNTGSYSDYSNTPANSTTYGRLYNWYAADNNTATKGASNGGKNVCPTGWHVPSDAEWTTLTENLGGISIAGGKIKETGTAHWDTPNTGATNETGFTALPGGYRNFDGTYYYSGYAGFWWSASEGDATQALYRYVYSYLSTVISSSTPKKNGFSIRCLRDN